MPSPTLKGRVMGAAQQAWAATDESPAAVSWWHPVLRLAACVVAAVSFVHAADKIDRYSLARCQSVMDMQDDSRCMASVDPALQMHPAFARLAALSVSQSGAETAELLLRHGERIRDAVRTTDTDGTAGPERPAGIPQSQLHREGAAVSSCQST
jgi:hypothetical protein